MLLDFLREFEWLNDPFNVRFDEAGMNVTSFENTDFWQALHHNIQKDNGHFFFTRKQGDFSFSAKWRFDKINPFDQCGIMVRQDNRNWFKISIMSEKLGTVATTRGYSDWAMQDIPEGTKEIWYKIRKVKGDYYAFFSVDGEKFHQTRLFTFPSESAEVKAGAYICTPNKTPFTAVLSDIEIC